MAEIVGKKGMIPAAIGCGAGVLGILTIGIVFVPIALICTILGFVFSIKTKNGAAIGVSVLSAILTVLGIIFSPTIWLIFGAGQILNDPTIQQNLNELKNEIKNEVQEIIKDDPQAKINVLRPLHNPFIPLPTNTKLVFS